MLFNIKNQKGVALVSAMGLTLVVFVASMALIYRLTNFTQILGTQRQKTQSHYTASSGVEETRDYFWNTGCIPPFWCGLLGMDLDPTEEGYPNIPKYSNVTFDITGEANPELYTTGTFYTLHLKDNNDDTNYTVDNDEVVTVLATATTTNPNAQGVWRDETRTSIEAMIIYTGGGGYKQRSQDVKRTGSTLEENVDMTPRQTF